MRFDCKDIGKFRSKPCKNGRKGKSTGPTGHVPSVVDRFHRSWARTGALGQEGRLGPFRNGVRQIVFRYGPAGHADTFFGGLPSLETYLRSW